MRWIAGPLGLAIVVTLINALKPVLIDDTAYLTFARHLAKQPLDPYGFTLHWYTLPDRAMDVLLPPVLPYWLALGISLFGEHIVLLKLWLFPFLWCFTKSLDVLLRRFANGAERIALPLIVLSPAVLPTVNFMLDIPAAALALAAIAVFSGRPALRSEDSASRLTSIIAGLLAGLAMQTKYTAMIAPAAILWYGITHRQIRCAMLACAASVAVFAAWEGLLFQKYGESHFLHHLAEQRAESGNWFAEKSALIPGLVGHLGLLGFGISLVALRAIGCPNRGLIGIAVAWNLSVVAISILPDDELRARTMWRPFGTGVVLVAFVAASLLVYKRYRLRMSRDSWFVAGWLLLEFAGYFALTPFPAARRVIGFTIIFGIVAARLLSRSQRIRPWFTPPLWMLKFSVAVGVLVAFLDSKDAVAEKVFAERAIMVAEGKGATRIWFAGHWGFQYYCERGGATHVVPGKTVIQSGEVLILPLYPDERPHVGNIPIVVPAEAVVELAAFQWSGALLQTVPIFYGGNEPVVSSGTFRLKIAVYRFKNTWSVPGP